MIYAKLILISSLLRRAIGFEKILGLIGISAIKAQRSSYNSFKDLRQSELSVYSQNGEDGILDFLLEQCGIQKPNILEIGAGNFQECNSRFCNLLRNSNLYLVDVHLAQIEFKKYFLQRLINAKIILDNTWVTKDNINSIIEKARNSLKDLHVLSIDLDGNDYWILTSITELDFDIIVLEYNPSLSICEPVSSIYKFDFDRKKEHYSYKYYGASLEAFVSFLNNRGYFFVGATSQGTNAFFLKNKYDKQFLNLDKTVDLYKNISSRESRDESGRLLLADFYLERNLLSNKLVINTETGETKKISQTG
jgi:hypothetical protein